MTRRTTQRIPPAIQADREAAAADARIIARKVGDIAAGASMDGLDIVTALLSGVLYVCRQVGMNERAISRWLRSVADFLDTDTSNSQAALRSSVNQKESKHGKAP